MRHRILPALALACVLVSCSRIHQKNFERIKNDMAESEVLAILGEPSDSESFMLGSLSAATSTWSDENGTITVQFVNGKVKLKLFSKEPPQEKNRER